LLLHNLDGQGLIADELFEPPILLFEVPDALELGVPEIAIHPFPTIKGLFRNIIFPEDFLVGGGFFGFAQDCYDLFGVEPFLGYLSSQELVQTNILAGSIFGGKVKVNVFRSFPNHRLSSMSFAHIHFQPEQDIDSTWEIVIHYHPDFNPNTDWIYTMPILTYKTQPNGLLVQCDQGQLMLSPYSSRAIRVRYTKRYKFNNQPSLMIVAKPDEHVHFDVRATEASLLFSTADLMIELDRQTLAFTYRDAGGYLLTREPARGGKTLEPVDVAISVFDEATISEDSENADGVHMRAGNVRKVVVRQAYHTKLEFEWAEGEALYGLGSHEEGMLNLRGQSQYLYQQNMKVAIPVLLSTRGYGILLDSYSLMTFHDDESGSYLWTDVDDEMDYYFIYGPEFDQIVRQLRFLTGSATMLPKWAFGYVQSKERYISQSELIEIVREYRTRSLPLDCIVQDWQYWTSDFWGQKSLDPERYPNPQQMMNDLHALHTRLMISICPQTRHGGSNWREMHDQGFLLGDQATYDAFNPAARACYWKQANDGLFSHGMDAWWCDGTEPFGNDWHGAIKLAPEAQMRINTKEAKLYLDPEVINVYSLLHSKGIYDGQRSVTRSKRVVNLTRSAYPGQQRYSTIIWSGDIAANWETLCRQIPAGLNFCVTGLPYWTLDIGAFFVKKKPELWFWCGDYNQGVEDLGYRELYTRWFQYGAFLPMFRAHGTDTPREIWRFGNPGEIVYDTLVKYLRLRYRLLPYIYSLAGLVTHQDYTMLRILPFDFRHDPNTYDIDNEYMFGSAFLVCPVTKPMYYVANSTPLEGVEKMRPVYLPSGSDWYNFWTGKRYTGGQTISADAPLETIPLYVRSGSIVPIGPEIQFTGDQLGAPIELWVYPGQDGAFTLYEDEGDNYNYEQGNFVTIHIAWNDSIRQLTLGNRQGSYPGMQASQVFRVVIANEKPFNPLASEATQAHEFLYDGRRKVVKI
jgi:alpha-D-xyloside xylohydrolase